MMPIKHGLSLPRVLQGKDYSDTICSLLQKREKKGEKSVKRE
jgi:hypothetical protein